MVTTTVTLTTTASRNSGGSRGFGGDAASGDAIGGGGAAMTSIRRVRRQRAGRPSSGAMTPSSGGCHPHYYQHGGSGSDSRQHAPVVAATRRNSGDHVWRARRSSTGQIAPIPEECPAAPPESQPPPLSSNVEGGVATSNGKGGYNPSTLGSLRVALASYGDLRDARSDRQRSDSTSNGHDAGPGTGSGSESERRRLTFFFPRLGFGKGGAYRWSSSRSITDADHAEAASLLSDGGGPDDWGSVDSSDYSVVSAASSFRSGKVSAPPRTFPGSAPVRKLRPPSWEGMCSVRRRAYYYYYHSRNQLRGTTTAASAEEAAILRNRQRWRQRCIGCALVAVVVSVVFLSASFVLSSGHGSGPSLSATRKKPHSSGTPRYHETGRNGENLRRRGGKEGGDVVSSSNGVKVDTHAGVLSVYDDGMMEKLRMGSVVRGERPKQHGRKGTAAATATVPTVLVAENDGGAGVSHANAYKALVEPQIVRGGDRGNRVILGSSAAVSDDAVRDDAIVDSIKKAKADRFSGVLSSSVVDGSIRSTNDPDSGFYQRSQGSFMGDRDKMTKVERARAAEMPPTLFHLTDLSAPYSPSLELPYFWDVHFSGESVAERYFTKCHGLIQAAEHGLRQPGYNEDALEVFSYKGNKFINVDMSTREGIDRAKRLGLTNFGSTGDEFEDDGEDGDKSVQADVVVSPALHDAATIFHPKKRGRMFALFRHPVDRAVSMYYYLSHASWDPLYHPELKDMTLVEYAHSPSIEHNWVTRFLVNKPRGGLTKADISLAKRVLRRKVLIGLYEDMDTSLARFQRYFGWDYDGDPNNDTPAERESVIKCRKAVVAAGDKRLTDHPTVEEGSPEWEAIAEQNRFDLALYEYATKLYAVQAKQIFGVV